MFSASAGLFVLAFLSLLAWVAAVAVAGRARMDGRVEQLLTSCLVWVALVDLPAYGLGWANLLYRPVLAGLSLVLSTATLVVCGIGRRPRAYLHKVLADLLAITKLPFDALVELARLRGFALLGAAVSAFAIIWTAWLSYLGPPSGWDGLWYHDTMVGFAIQNHGFRLVDVPQSLAVVNGFPRICETLNLWFAIFGDRRLIDLPNSLMAVPLLAAVYLLVRRYTADREYGAACATAMLLMPGVVLQLRSTYIDLTIIALTAAAMHFATRPHLRLRDVWLAAGALGLVLGTKFHAVAHVPLLGLVLAVRLIATHGRARPVAMLLTAVGGTALLLAIGAPNYIRNWIYYHNPLYPYQTDAVQQVTAAAATVKASDHVFINLFGEMLSQPVPGKDWPDIRQHGYGLGLPLLVLPMGLCAAVIAPFAALASLLQSARRTRTLNLLYTTVPLLVTIPFSPALSYARYNTHVVIAFLLLASWLVGRPGWERIRQGIGATLVTTSVILLWWAAPRWCMTWKQAVELFGMSPQERAGAHVVDFLPEPKAVHARETELKPGDIVVFTDSYTFPAVNWNERYTNRLVWIPSALGPEQVLQRAVELGAKWISVTTFSPEYMLLRARPDAWQEVGHLSTTNPPQIAFRRVGAS